MSLPKPYWKPTRLAVEAPSMTAKDMDLIVGWIKKYGWPMNVYSDSVVVTAPDPSRPTDSSGTSCTPA